MFSSILESFKVSVGLGAQFETSQSLILQKYTIFFIITYFRCVLRCVVVRTAQELLELFRGDPKRPAHRAPKEQQSVTRGNGAGTTVGDACSEPRRKSLSKRSSITTCFCTYTLPNPVTGKLGLPSKSSHCQYSLASLPDYLTLATNST